MPGDPPQSNPAPPPPPPPSDPPAGAPRAQEIAMGSTVGLGALWMMAATILAKGATFISQIILGLWLFPDDFALFSMAAASTKLLSICQDAGIKDLLIQRGPAEYPRLSGRVFWFAAVFNTWVGLFVAAAAPLVALFYDEPRLRNMIWVLVLAFPLGTPGAVLSTKLRLDLRFRATSLVMIVSSLIRQGGQVCLAYAAMGAMSFVYPAVAAALVESVMCWWISRDAPWRRPAERHTWRQMLRDTKYLILGSMANLLLDQGPYLVLQPAMRLLGGVATESANIVQGNVYWAFQMTAQIGVLLSYNMQLVLTPVFQRLAAEPARLRDAVVRSLSGLMLVGSISSLMFGVMMDPVEKFAFSGKWEPATNAVEIYALFFPFRITYGLVAALLLAMGRFRAYFCITLLEGIVFTLSAVVAGAFADSAADVAWWTGGALALIMILTTVHTLRTIGVHSREILVELFWPWLLAVLAALIAYAADASLDLESLVTREWLGPELHVTIARGSGLAGSLADLVKSTGLSPAWQARAIEFVRLLVIGAAGALSFLAIARMLMPDILRAALAIAPGRLSRPATRVLRL